jgi:hypothetical protein
MHYVFIIYKKNKSGNTSLHLSWTEVTYGKYSKLQSKTMHCVRVKFVEMDILSHFIAPPAYANTNYPN